MAMLICKGCKDDTPEHDTLEGYCMLCASQRIRGEAKFREQIKELEVVLANEKSIAAKAYTACSNYQQRIKELERDYVFVESLCDYMDEFGEPMKDTQWTKLGERIYEIVAEQADRIKELKADAKINHSVVETIETEITKINENLKNQLEELEFRIVQWKNKAIGYKYDLDNLSEELETENQKLIEGQQVKTKAGS